MTRTVFVAAFLAAALLPARADAQAVAFAPKVDRAAGNVRAVAVADLNSDGRPDLVTANGTSHSVSVFLSTGNGAFAPKVDYATGSVPVSVVTADVDRDGRVDVMTANSVGGSVSLLLNTGGGVLGYRTDFPAGGEPRGVAAADLNRDGKVDVVTANAGTGTISVLFGNGFGSFAPKMDFAVSGTPQALTIADVNADGRPDVITANAVPPPGAPPFPGGNDVSVLLNGTFNQHTDFPTGTTPVAVATIDLNRDGRLDLVVANDGSNSLSVLHGTGTGSFGPKTDYATGARPQALAVGDVDGDGKPDVSAVSLTTSTVSVFRSLGFGSLGSGTDFPAGTGPAAVALADVNGDTKLDLVTGNRDAGTVSVLTNITEFTRAGWFGGFKVSFDTSPSPAGLAVGDLSGDGKPDLAVTNSIENTVSVILDVTYLGWVIRTDYATGLSPKAVALADFNRDGKPDLVVANQAAGTVSILLGTGFGNFGPKSDIPTGAAPADVAAGDVNGDAIPDIVTANNTADTVSVLIGIGDGSFAPKVDFATRAAPIALEVADITGDGRADVMVLNAFADTISLLPAALSGLLGPRLDFATGVSPSGFALGDINGDGRVDIAVANRASDTAGSVTVLLGTGPGTFQPAGGAIPIPAAPGRIALGDVNRDGRLDLAVTNASDNTASVLLGFGDGQFQARNVFPTALLPVDVALADINVDGMLDLVVVNDDHVTVSVNTVPPTSDVSITLDDAPDPVVSGDTVTYTATVSNAGPDTAQGVTVRATAPTGGGTLVSATAAGGCILSGTPSCFIGAVESGSTATATFVVQSSAVGTIAFGVTVTGNVLDGVAANNSAAETTVVTPAPPAIVTQPTDVTALPGQQPSFSVSAAGTPPLSYQWQLSTDGGASWTDIYSLTPIPYMDAGTPMLQVTQVTHAMNGYRFRCVVTNVAGTATSAAAVLTVPPPPVVSAVTPSRGSARGGLVVTITGSGFVPGADVTFGGMGATDIVVVDSTKITGRTPEMIVGAQDVMVTNPDGQSGMLSAAFTAIEPDERSADLNGDGEVDIYDASILTACLNQIPAPGAPCASADLDYDGTVTLADLDLLKEAYGQTGPMAGLRLLGASPTAFNTVGGSVAFEVIEGTVGPPLSIGVYRNGAPVDEASVWITETTIEALAILQEGPNDLTVIGETADGRPLRADVSLWAGAALITGTVVDESGLPVAGATVAARLGDDQTVGKTTTASGTGEFFFANVPARSIVFTAMASGNRVGSLIARGDAEEIQLVVTGIGQPSSIDNNDFSLGLQGWDIGSAPATLVPHEEGGSSTADSAAAGDLDLRVSTFGQGPQHVSRTFTVPPGNQKVSVRYRFITSEVPGGYFGTQFNDGFEVRLQSQRRGASAVVSATMNGLGRDAFDANGATVWRELSVPVSAAGDVVRVGATVTNVADGKLDSYLFVDRVGKGTLRIAHHRLLDIDKQPLQFLSAAQHSYKSGNTEVFGTITIEGSPTDALESLVLEVWKNGSKVAASLNAVTSDQPELVKPFGADRKVEVKKQRLFLIESQRFASLESASGDDSVILKLHATTRAGDEVTELVCTHYPCDLNNPPKGDIKILSKYRLPWRYGGEGRDHDVCVLTEEQKQAGHKVIPCGGDDWVRPYARVVFNSFPTAVKWNDFSNMNGGDFPPHKTHSWGFAADGKFAGYNPKGLSTLSGTPELTAKAMLDLLNTPLGCQVSSVLVTTKSEPPNDPFWQRIWNVPLRDGRLAQTVIKYISVDHADHFHMWIRPSCTLPGPPGSSAPAGQRRIDTRAVSSVPAAAPAIVTVDTDPATPGIQTSRAVAVGQPFTVDLVVETGTQPLAGFDLGLSFDANVVALRDVQRVGGFGGSAAYDIVMESMPGDARIAAVLTGTPAPSNGGVVRFTFDALVPGGAGIIATLANLAGPSGARFNVTHSADPQIDVTPPSGCAYAISPASRAVPAGEIAGSVSVTASSDCGWVAASQSDWIGITAGATGTSGGTVAYTVDANTGALPRIGTMTIAGQLFTIFQAGRSGPSDFDGNGAADRTVFRPGVGTWFIQGQPNRQWGWPGDVPVPGDYDGDGMLDTAVYRPSTGDWLVPDQAPVPWGRAGDIPVPADYDGDGSTDPAVYRTTDGILGVWHVRGQFTQLWGLRGDIPVPADYDGDGRADLAVYRPSTGTWYVAYSRTGFATNAAFVWGAVGDVPMAGDFDGDGRTDLSVFRPSTGWWYLALSATNYATAAAHPWGLPGDVPLAFDVDGDRVDELTVFRPGDGSWWHYNRITGAATTAQHGVRGDVPVLQRPQLPLVRTADFDGDRLADVTVFRPGTGEWFTRTSSTNYGPAPVHQWGLAGDIKATGDYDGDRRADLAVYRPSNGFWYLRFSSTNFATIRAEQWGLAGDLPQPADYDGDGRTDLAVYRPSTGQWFVRLSSTDYATFLTHQWGLSADVPQPADYDGDGRADLAVFRPTTGQWFVTLSSGAFGGVIVKQWGLSSDVPVAADFDGDARADLAVYRPSTGQWYWLDALTNLSGSVQWGLPGDIPVPHDYDGDGRIDPAIFRPAGGEWFVKLSSTGAVLYLQWGLSGDLPD